MSDKLASPDEVVKFWREAGPDRWYKKDPAFDEEIRRRFLACYEAAAAGKLNVPPARHTLREGRSPASQ